MLDPESIRGVQAIVDAHQDDMTASTTAAAEARERGAEAQAAVATAQEVADHAQEGLAAAVEAERHTGYARQRADTVVEMAAVGIAAEIAGDLDLDPLSSTLHALVFGDRRLAWGGSPSAFEAAAERGRVALSSIVKRLQPGVPVLYFDEGQVVAGVATEQTLSATRPRVAEGPGISTTIHGGSIELTLPEASAVRVVGQNLPTIEHKLSKVILLNPNGYDVERLEKLATNSGVLVIGTDGIAARLEGMDPDRQFTTLSALHAAGVEAPVEVEPEYGEYVEQRLVALMTFLAAGAETDARGRHSTGRHNQSVLTEPQLTRMSEEIGPQSIKNVAEIIGLDKKALRAKVVAAINTKSDKGDVSLARVARGAESNAVLERLLDAIF